MIISITRPNKCITALAIKTDEPIYKNTIGYHELVVRVGLYPGESVMATFSWQALGVSGETNALPMSTRYVVVGTENIAEYFVKLPKQVVTTSGQKTCAIAIIEPVGSDQFRQVTSGNISFTVLESNATKDYDLMDTTFATITNARVEEVEKRMRELEKIGLAPDISEANNVGEVSVSVDPTRGNLVFRNLKGKTGDKGADGINGTNGVNGVNGTVQWGENSPCPISTLQWKII